VQEANLGHLVTSQQCHHEREQLPRSMHFVDERSDAVRVVQNVLSASECTSFIEAANKLNFSSPKNFEARDRVCERVHTVDVSLSTPMMDRLRAFLPEVLVVDGARWRLSRFTHHWRYVRYFSGGHFAPHYDGSKMLPGQQMSMLTVQIYLNSRDVDFTGGDTRFYMDYIPEHHASHQIVDGQSRRALTGIEELTPTHSVRPSAGDVLIFDHGGRSIFHDAEPVLDGCKYILRGDLLYTALQEDMCILQNPTLPPEMRKWCPETAADFGTRNFMGQVWKCDCAKDHHGSSCCIHVGDISQSCNTPTCSTACSSCSDVIGCPPSSMPKVCILVSGKRACGKDYVASALQATLEIHGFRVGRCALGSINKRTYAAKVGIDAVRLETELRVQGDTSGCNGRTPQSSQCRGS
jgi:hypothetical protein